MVWPNWERMLSSTAGRLCPASSVAVAPGSIGSARLSVATPHGGYRKVYLEIHSERVLLQVEAPKPPDRPRVHPLAIASAVLALGVVSVGGGCL